MKILLLVLFIVIAAPGEARPVFIESSAPLPNPDPVNWPYFGRQVAIDGDHALVLGEQVTQPPEGGELQRHRIVWVYRRDGAAWNLVGPLAPAEVIDGGDGFTPALGLKNGIAVTLLRDLNVYRLVAGSFVRENIVPPRLDLNGPDLEIDGARILVGANGCSWDAAVLERDATGTWRQSGAVLRGNGPPCGDALNGGPLDLSGDRAVLFNAETYDPDTLPPHAKTYRNLSGAGWLPQSEIAAPASATRFGPELALRANRLFVAGSNESGTYVFDLSGANPGVPVDRLRPVDSYAGGGAAFAIEKSAGLVLQRSLRADRYENTVINAFRQLADGRYAHVASLVGRSGLYVRGRIDISSDGRDVIGATSAALAEFTQVVIWRLPATFTTPAVRQDNFESGAAAWTQTAGSRFEVVQRGPTRVFRQSNAAIDARALLSNSDWTTQAIEADITITSAPTAQDRGVGLFTRYQNPQNYFQAVFTTRGIWLSRMGSGRLTQVTISPDFPVIVGRTYRLRLESTHAWQRVYVDGQIVIDQIARGPTHGAVGLVTETSTADFDNVVVTPTPLTPIYRSDFTSADTTAWSTSGAGIWTVRSGVFAQSSVAGDARALIGTPTGDQVVRASVQLGAFGTGGTADKWFGVAARASNERNYYYLALRSSNTLQLRKLVDGTISTLASVPVTVTRGRPYVLQLEAVGTRLRARLDGALQFEVTDGSHASGQPGLVAYRAAVDYDDFVAEQP
jgi:hypothetical protein